jgi:hypothetical protein
VHGSKGRRRRLAKRRRTLERAGVLVPRGHFQPQPGAVVFAKVTAADAHVVDNLATDWAKASVNLRTPKPKPSAKEKYLRRQGRVKC